MDKGEQKSDRRKHECCLLQLRRMGKSVLCTLACKTFISIQSVDKSNAKHILLAVHPLPHFRQNQTHYKERELYVNTHCVTQLANYCLLCYL